jgi:hypothetical protein
LKNLVIVSSGFFVVVVFFLAPKVLPVDFLAFEDYSVSELFFSSSFISSETAAVVLVLIFFLSPACD